MATINMESILAKARKATATSEFQKKIEQKVDSAVLNGGFGGIGGSGDKLGGFAGGSSGGGSGITSTPPNNPADKFIEVLQNEIKNCFGADYASGQLGKTAIDALVKLDRGEPVKSGKYKYKIAVWFTEDLRRDSLDPSEYGGIDNIAALLNSGYTAGKTVYGIWLGHSPWNIPSLTHRNGAHFIENAIRNFMANYAHEYGVIDIKVDDVYK